MALGDLTKLAGHALGNPVKGVLDSLRPPDLSQIADSLRTAKPAPPAAADNVGAIVVGQLQAMQKAAREDEELVILYHAGEETVRVLEIFAPSWRVLVLSGIDAEKNITRVVAPADTLQLMAKVVKTQPPARPARVNFVLPKPRE